MVWGNLKEISSLLSAMLLPLYYRPYHFIFCTLCVIVKKEIFFCKVILSIEHFEDFYFIFFWTLSQFYSKHFVRSEIFFRTDSINPPEVSTYNTIRTTCGHRYLLILHLASGEKFLIICYRTYTKNIEKKHFYVCICWLCCANQST